MKVDPIRDKKPVNFGSNARTADLFTVIDNIVVDVF